MEEIWKDVVGYEGYYKVSNLGNVKSLTRKIYQSNYSRIIQGKNMKSHINGSGYLQCPLNKEGKRYYAFVHKLVAEAFINNPENYDEVNHINHDKLNNNKNNLEWCSRKDNIDKMHEFYGTKYLGNYCDECNIEISRDSFRCVPCENKNKVRKVKDRPTKEDLNKLLIELNFSKVGILYGVSDNAVRKWCKQYGMSTKSADYK